MISFDAKTIILAKPACAKIDKNTEIKLDRGIGHNSVEPGI